MVSTKIILKEYASISSLLAQWNNELNLIEEYIDPIIKDIDFFFFLVKSLII